MTDQAAEADATANIPVEDWIPHTKSDSADYLDAQGVTYDDLTPEQQAQYDAAQAEKTKTKE